jgi:hypothetical protein
MNPAFALASIGFAIAFVVVVAAAHGRSHMHVARRAGGSATSPTSSAHLASARHASAPRA